jgi:hypothetical protein
MMVPLLKLGMYSMPEDRGLAPVILYTHQLRCRRATPDAVFFSFHVVYGVMLVLRHGYYRWRSGFIYIRRVFRSIWRQCLHL